MPRIVSITEFRFVRPYLDADGKETWRDARGFQFEIVRDHLTVEAYAGHFEYAIVRARDQVKLCAEMGHHGVGGCGGWSGSPVDPEPACKRALRCVESESRTNERTMLVRITVPVP